MLTKLLSFFRQQQKVRTCELTNNESDLGLSLDDELESQFDSEEVPEDGSENETGSEIHPRCDWATIDSIPDSLYESLVSEVCSLGGGFPRPLTTKIRYEKGTFNGASFVASARSGELDVFVVRVPGHATREHWTPFDAYMLEREAQILGYMGRNINAPVPTLCDYSTSFDKPLSHP